ncbi:hypothetical protein BC629DRAFT_1088357 [Irpex lacteus]|nr:hypothetical protein BC629DRAFT_1088357 [Irpex lacteus]
MITVFFSPHRLFSCAEMGRVGIQHPLPRQTVPLDALDGCPSCASPSTPNTKPMQLNVLLRIAQERLALTIAWPFVQCSATRGLGRALRLGYPDLRSQEANNAVDDLFFWSLFALDGPVDMTRKPQSLMPSPWSDMIDPRRDKTASRLAKHLRRQSSIHLQDGYAVSSTIYVCPSVFCPKPTHVQINLSVGTHLVHISVFQIERA